MRSFFKLWILIALFSLAACEKDTCASNQDEQCQDLPESGACLAAFQSWFYNSQSNTCELISYSGCEQKGFSSEEACQACICNN